MTKTSILYVTAPDDNIAQHIPHALVEEKLAACVNVFGRIESIYRWNGAVEKAEETAMIVKSASARAAAARERIIALHPYDCPCVIEISLAENGSNPAFLDWIIEETTADG